MSDYYEILGIEETASEEEIEAHWAELMKRYRPHLYAREGKISQRIKEIAEAYDVLKDPSKRKEYDLERAVKRSILKEIHERRKERYRRKRRRLISVGVVLLLLVAGFLVFKITQLTLQYKRMASTPAPVSEEKKPIIVSKSVPQEMQKAPDEKTSKTIPEKIAKSQETISPVAEVPRKELEVKEKRAKELVKAEKIIPSEMPMPDVSVGLKPVPEERPKVEEPKAATTYVPVPEKVQIKTVPKEVTKEVARVLPKEVPKAVPPEPPTPAPSRPKEVKPPEQPGDVAQIPSAKPSPPIAAIPPMPHPFVRENEVKQFLERYVDRYIQRDLEGFLSLFSSRAIQNQKDGIDGIRKIYSRQFGLYERFNYRLKDPKIEILEMSVKVRALYEIEQFSKKGEAKQLRGEIAWELVKEEERLKILAVQYRPIK